VRTATDFRFFVTPSSIRFAIKHRRSPHLPSGQLRDDERRALGFRSASGLERPPQQATSTNLFREE
jgi:hypothetical protein